MCTSTSSRNGTLDGATHKCPPRADSTSSGNQHSSEMKMSRRQSRSSASPLRRVARNN